MSDCLPDLMADLETLLIALKKCGLDKTGTHQLVAITERINCGSAPLGQQDLAELTAALAIVLNEFIASPPDSDSCIPIIQSAFKLSAQLGKQAVSVADIPGPLPSHAFAWVFLLLDAHAMLAVTDSTGLITYANQPFADVTGHSLSPLAGSPHPILADLQKENGLIWQKLFGGKLWQGETAHTTPAGQPYWLQSTILPITNNTGKATHYVSIHTDVTAAKQAIKAPGCDSDINCEMRTLLNSILGHSQLLLMQDDLDGETYEQLQEITLAGQKLAALLDKASEQGGTAACTVTEAAPPAKQPPKRPPHILVAEDDVANQAVLRMQLNVLGVQADVAKDGQEAWENWQNHSYDLVLADLHMPGLDGLELTCRIRLAEHGSGQHVPVIGISADHSPEVLAACNTAGMDGTLAKPIELENLKNLLQTWLAATAPIAPPLGVATRTTITKPAHYQPILDMAYLANIVGCLETSQVHSLLELFTGSARTDLSLCRQYILQKDTAALALIMHKLKSSAQSIGALHFASYAKNLEHAAHQGRLGKVVALITELERALDDLEALLNDPLEGQISLGTTVRPLSYRALVIDHDPENLRRLTRLLHALGTRQVYTATRIGEVLDVFSSHPRINLLLYKINMPGMDGLALLGHLVELGYQGCIILLDGGDDERLLEATVDLVGKQGLHLLGSLCKPYARNDLLALMQASCEKMGEMAKKVSGQNLSPEDILEGLYHNEFDVFFQPKADAFSLRPTGVEALARWRRQGLILPADAFIVAAEHFNLIGQLSEMLLIKAFIGGARLAAMGVPLTLSVNLSAHWLADEELPDFIKASLQATGLPMENLILEIGEAVLLEDMEHSLRLLNRLQAKGLKLAVDHFCGDLPLGYLQKASFSELKMARGMIRQASQTAEARGFVSDLMATSSKLKLTSVAEGVENLADLKLAQALGCDLVQGWFIGKAMPIDELVSWLQINKMF